MLDPDPLRPRETDDIQPSAEFVAGYDAGWTDAERMPAVRALFLGILVGVAAALGAIALAVHRS